MLPHSLTHKSTMAPLNIDEHLFSPGEGGQRGGLLGEKEGLRDNKAGLEDAMRMPGRSGLWTDRFCFGIT